MLVLIARSHSGKWNLKYNPRHPSCTLKAVPPTYVDTDLIMTKQALLSFQVWKGTANLYALNKRWNIRLWVMRQPIVAVIVEWPRRRTSSTLIGATRVIAFSKQNGIHGNFWGLHSQIHRWNSEQASISRNSTNYVHKHTKKSTHHDGFFFSFSLNVFFLIKYRHVRHILCLSLS